MQEAIYTLTYTREKGGVNVIALEIVLRKKRGRGKHKKQQKSEREDEAEVGTKVKVKESAYKCNSNEVSVTCVHLFIQ